MRKRESRLSYSTPCKSILAAITYALIVLGTIAGLFKWNEAYASNRNASQEKNAETAFLLQYENNGQLPVTITEAILHVSESSQPVTTAPANATDIGNPTDNAVGMRPLRFTAKIINQGTYPITQLKLTIENPSALPNQIITIICKIPGAGITQFNPNDQFSFSRLMYLEEKRYGKELMNHLSDFRINVIGISSSSDEDQTWKLYSLPEYDDDGMIVLRSRKDVKAFPYVQILDKNRWVALTSKRRLNPTDIKQGSASGSADDQGVFPISRDVRPVILYKEKATYTRTARDNGIQGVVILHVVFSADGTLTNIKVIQELPDGLTEQAINAAKKIRFKPAMRNGTPVSVRGNLEFSFNLYSRSRVIR